MTIRRRLSRIAAFTFALSFLVSSASAKGDDFKAVVKLIEEFYGVKHEGIPFIARAGMKVVGTAAKVKGGEAGKLADLGSVKLAIFDDQPFAGDFTRFRSRLNETLNQTWTPLVQTMESAGQEQTYIFVRSAGDKFNVLVITIESREGTVVQANVSAKALAKLITDPESAGRTISEATTIDNE